jgi:hypothetical protein
MDEALFLEDYFYCGLDEVEAVKSDFALLRLGG